MPKKNPTRENEATQETAGCTMTNSMTEHNEPMQETETGHRIPIPSKKDVLSDLGKVATKKPSRLRRAKKKR